MSTAIAKPETGVVMFDVTDTEIAEMQSKYLALSVNGVNDKGGLVIVHEARMKVKNLRVSIEKRRKKLNEDALNWQREVNAAAKGLVSRLEPIEKHLEDQEAIIEREKQRLKDEAAAKAKAALDARLEQLTAVGAMVNPATVAAMGDAAFAEYLATCTKANETKLAAEAEAKRIADEQAAALAAERAELERLRKEAADKQAAIDAENARVKAEQQAAQAKIDADNARIKAEQEAAQRAIDVENARLAAIEHERQRQEELAKAREEAAAKAKAEAQAELEATAERQRLAEVERVAAEKRAADEAEAARIREAELRPDRDKLLAVASTLDAMEIPTVGRAAEGARKRIVKVIDDAVAEITRIAATVK